MGHRLLAVALLAASGCYRPAIDACLYRCDNGVGCPSNLVCTTDHWCAETSSMSCDSIGTDGPIADARPDAACGWATTNVDACALMIDKLTDDWTIGTSETVTISTDAATITSSSFPTGGYQALQEQEGPTTDRAFVIGVHDLSVQGTIVVQGNTPLIILASGQINIRGTIQVGSTNQSGATCTGNMGGSMINNQNGGGGGGGGSLGGPGGKGGEGGNFSGGLGAPGGNHGIAVPTALAPLRGGCSGGSGGNAGAGGSLRGGDGGAGGGGLQLSARTLIFVNGGTINASGDPGRSPSDGQGGGGGGGSGGGIFLESPSVQLAGNGVCANGGGGGSSRPGNDGGRSTCNVVGAGGGGGTLDGGGDGAANAVPAGDGKEGSDQQSSSPPAHGGGGGGGGAGRIRIRGTVSGAGTTSPPFTNQ